MEEIDNAWKLCPFSIDIRLAYRSFKYKSSNVCCQTEKTVFLFLFYAKRVKLNIVKRGFYFIYIFFREKN